MNFTLANLAFFPDDSYEIKSLDGRIGLWDMRSSKSCLMYLDSERSNSKTNISSSLSRSATAHSGAIVSLTYTPDYNHILSLGKDNKLRLWDASNGRNTLVNYGRVPLSTGQNHTTETCIQMSCSDESAFVPSGAHLLMFGIYDGVSRKTLKGHFEPVTCCVYNSVLNEVYTGSRDRNILIWDTQKDLKLGEDEKKAETSSAGVYSVLSSTGRSTAAATATSQDNWSDDEL